MDQPYPLRDDPALDPRLAWAAAGLVLASGVLHLALEHLTRGFEPLVLLRWRLLPALLWAGAAPWIVRAGFRWPLGGGARLRGGVLLLAAFAGWHLAVNVVLRLPDLGRRDAAWLLADSVSAWVVYAPESLSLFLLLVLGGHVARIGRGRAATAGGQADPTPAPTLSLPGPNRIHRVRPGEIRWLEADGDHVHVHVDGRSYRVRGTLEALERALAPTGRFVRIHRSSLVDAERVREVQPLRHGNWVAVLDDGTELRIPRTRRNALDRLRAGQGANHAG